MSRFKLWIASLFGISILAVVSGAGLGVASAEDIQGNLCKGAELSLTTGGSCNPSQCKSNSGGGNTVSCEKKVNSLITTIINVFSVVVGIVAVIMIVYGGFRYITSGGDSNNTAAAKNTILYAIVGLVIVALAQFIVRFILSKVT